ncbi:MAG: D-tyrosyl-tRNA(Tyr) deacylase [Candidatus Marinimicrobia bacterium]|nr:D-tyrosyl-tRNA(Tyr) deacylase [Candidatus Neomarinimicrobiota bacterium]RKY61755.1 MAG: D-tyrosyl-tRNA(Tyr) deacylase [Candidatus Neomarinimicrobiota bacterium]
MIAVIQRCKQASVTVADEEVGRIDHGLVVLLGVFQDDNEADADFLISKIIHLRIFNDENGKMNRSLTDVNGSLLVVSQFTLCGDWRKGRRPSFIRAAEPKKGAGLYNYFVQRCREESVPTATGRFGAMMDVHLVNEGPVTFVLDSRLK